MLIQIPIIILYEQTNVHLEFIPNHEFAKMCVRYQVPNIVNNTAINIIEKIHIHSLKRFAGYIKLITLQLYQEKCHLEFFFFIFHCWGGICTSCNVHCLNRYLPYPYVCKYVFKEYSM